MHSLMQKCGTHSENAKKSRESRSSKKSRATNGNKQLKKRLLEIHTFIGMCDFGIRVLLRSLKKLWEGMTHDTVWADGTTVAM
jgi:hypothetical protein